MRKKKCRSTCYRISESNFPRSSLPTGGRTLLSCVCVCFALGEYWGLPECCHIPKFAPRHVDACEFDCETRRCLSLKYPTVPQDSRKSIREPQGAHQGPVKSLVFGLQRSKVTPGLFVSRATARFPELVATLHAIADVWTDDFRYSSVYIGMDFRTSEHTDQGNVPPALTISVGDFSGGEFATGETRLVTHNRLTLVDVSEPHYTAPFELLGPGSHRWVVVYYTRRDGHDLSSRVVLLGTSIHRVREVGGFRFMRV